MRDSVQTEQEAQADMVMRLGALIRQDGKEAVGVELVVEGEDELVVSGPDGATWTVRIVRQ